MTYMTQAQYIDADGQTWLVAEQFLPTAPAGILVFTKGDRERCCWGSPIDWRNATNLRVLFDLSVDLSDAAA